MIFLESERPLRSSTMLFLFMLISFTHSLAMAQVDALSDKEALDIIWHSSGLKNKYFLKPLEVQTEGSASEFYASHSKNLTFLKKSRMKNPGWDIDEYIVAGLPEQILSLIPSVPFRIIQVSNGVNRELGALLDKIISDILRTPLGSKICTSVTLGNRRDIMAYFDLSASAASELQKSTCPPTGNFKNLPPEVKSMLDLGEKERHHFPLFQFLAFEEDLELPFESFTTTNRREDEKFGVHATLGKTYIHIDPKRFKLSSLYRIIAHELVMRVDYRSQIPPIDEVDGLIEKGNLCSALKKITHPQIRMSMSLVRAFQWENQILKELGLVNEKVADEFAAQSCVNKIKQVFPFTRPLKSWLKQESQLNAIILNSRCPGDTNDFSLDGIESALNLLLRDRKGNESTLCESLINTFSIDWEKLDLLGQKTSFHPGPRPPIGRGTGSNRSGSSPEAAADIMVPYEPPEGVFRRFNEFSTISPGPPK